MLQNAAAQNKAQNAIGCAPFANTTTTENCKAHSMGWSFSGEQDSLMQRLFTNLQQNNSHLISPFSKSIRKNKKVRNLNKSQGNSKRIVSEGHPGFKFDEKAIEDDRSDLGDPVFYNLASPSSFLNIESLEKQNLGGGQNEEEELKNACLEQKEEVFVPIFEEIKE